MNLDHIKNIHFLGIGGIGMSGIAEILSSSGVVVSGCDLKTSNVTALLASRGITVVTGHDPVHLDGADALVITAAARGANAEIDEAIRRGIPILRRSEMLGHIVNRRRGIGVSGTHGKTTTSAMIAVVLEEAGLDPTIIVGGMLRNLSSNARSGEGDFVVVEADEYDRTFHHLHPEVAVITNIEADHLEYYGSLEAIVEAFRIFVEGVPTNGMVIGCGDDEATARILAGCARKTISYGLGEGCDVRATGIEFQERGSSFEVSGIGFFKLFVPGEHNIRNALAAIVVGHHLGIPTEVIRSALAGFLGVDRRFQVIGDFHGAVVVDDYAHHPTEIRATLAAARSGYPNRRLVALFQPHLFSRTRDFAGDFADALSGADLAILAPIFAAREKPVEGISSRLIAENSSIEFIDKSNEELAAELRKRLEPNDIFVAMGAGDVHEVAEMLVRLT